CFDTPEALLPVLPRCAPVSFAGPSALRVLPQAVAPLCALGVPAFSLPRCGHAPLSYAPHPARLSSSLHPLLWHQHDEPQACLLPLLLPLLPSPVQGGFV